MNVLFGNPNINSDGLGREIKAILDSGWVSIGEYVEALENHFKERTGVKHAIATSSATTGLIIAIKAAGWKNMNIALPSFTWPSTLYAIQCNGNHPIFTDIDSQTWLASGLVNAERAVIIDTFGNQFTPDSTMKKEDLIIDAAHGYGLPNLGKRGLAEVVSLSFTKVVTAMEGGIILTDNDELAETARELRRLSGRMGEINALIALQSIKNYNPEATKSIINYYKKHITVPHRCQEVVNDTNNSVFSMLFSDSAVRDAIRIALAKAGVETKVYYDPLKKGFPNTEDIYSRILSLPIHRDVPEWQDRIIEIINTAGRGARTPGKEFLTK
jgi:dTDP-4-amino-4,6-dideoxygalactose transaminase